MQSTFALFRKYSRFLFVAANLLGHSIWGACSFDASVGSKLCVTFGFVFSLHFIKRIAHGRAERFKLPVTLGATEALKILALNPF
jgi:hypothetical protein